MRTASGSISVGVKSHASLALAHRPIGCLVEDPVTRKHQPRNYVETLEARVALLEEKLRIADLDDSGPLSENQPATDTAPPKDDDDGASELSTRVGMLGLTMDGEEPHYLGSSSIFSFSRILHSSLRRPVPRDLVGAVTFLEEGTPIPSPCPLPDYEFGVTLSNAYFENIHPQYPFLHEPTFRRWEEGLAWPSQGIDAFGFNPVPLFFVNMVGMQVFTNGTKLTGVIGICSWSVASVMCRISTPGITSTLLHGLVMVTDWMQQLYLSANLYAEEILSRDNLQSIQAILMYAMYSLRSATGPSLWKLSGLALRQSIELGYHRGPKRFGGSTVDCLRLEMRKRAFWCAFGIDCVATVTLGRPLGIPLREIDAEVGIGNYPEIYAMTKIVVSYGYQRFIHFGGWNTRVSSEPLQRHTYKHVNGHPRPSSTLPLGSDAWLALL